MSNFNTPINAGGLLDTINDSKQTKEDRYIRDRECYIAGRSGQVVSYNSERDQSMHNMGAAAYDRLGSPS